MAKKPQRNPGNAVGQGGAGYEPPRSPGNMWEQGEGYPQRIDTTREPSGAYPWLDEDDWYASSGSGRRRMPRSISGRY